MTDFDAIVIGSGMTGGWAAKELAERGLKVLVLERGRDIDPASDYTDMQAPWEMPNTGMLPEIEKQRDYPIQSEVYAMTNATKQFWVKDNEHPYETPPDRPYSWFRGFHLGGKSIMWGRQTYRWSPADFESNKNDGHGIDWAIRYKDLEPWYDHVETFAGISGSSEGLESLPDSKFLPAFELNCAEQHVKEKVEAAFPTRRIIIGRCAHLTKTTDTHSALGRGLCQVRSHCERGCTYGAYFSSISATLPAARNTGRTTIVTDAIVTALVADPQTRRINEVRVIDAKTRVGKSYRGRMVFLCASTIPSAMILLNSRSDAFPTGIANSSDQVGRNLMDHVGGARIAGKVPGFLDRYYKGRRPTGIYVPRYGNLTETDKPYLRGFGFQGWGYRAGWSEYGPGIGDAIRQANRTPGPWQFELTCFGEQVPGNDSRVTLNPSRRDQWDMPVPVISAEFGENERKIIIAAIQDGKAMLKAAGCVDIQAPSERNPVLSNPGNSIHEMGTARMGRDPRNSVVNGWCQSHDIANLFITDGSVMASTATQNPSLTYMALTARAAAHAVDLVKSGVI